MWVLVAEKISYQGEGDWVPDSSSAGFEGRGNSPLLTRGGVVSSDLETGWILWDLAVSRDENSGCFYQEKTTVSCWRVKTVSARETFKRLTQKQTLRVSRAAFDLTKRCSPFFYTLPW